MRRRKITLAASFALLATTARGQPIDPLGQADVISTLGVARVADELGDRQLGAWLAAKERRDLAAVAVRASPFADAPERLVPDLARLLCSRDPILAPESGHALLQIAEHLTPSGLAAREAALSDVKAARAALACVREVEPAVRPDLAAIGILVESSLAQLLP